MGGQEAKAVTVDVDRPVGADEPLGSGRRLATESRVRVLFLNENIGGHATVHHHLRIALAERDDIEPVFFDVPKAGFVRRALGVASPGLGRLDIDLQPLRAQLALSASVRRRLPKLIDGVDLVHVYTQTSALRAGAEVTPPRQPERRQAEPQPNVHASSTCH